MSTPRFGPISYIKAATREGIGVLAIGDKPVFDNYINGTLAEDQLPKDVVDPMDSSSASSEMQVDAKDEDSDFTVSASISSSDAHISEWELLTGVLDRERSVHNAKSVLIAPSKDFKALFASQFESKPSTSAARPAHDRYQARSDQEYYRNIGLGTEDIDTRGSMFLSASERGSAPGGAGSSAPRSSSSSAPMRRPAGEVEGALEAKRAKTGLKPIIVVPGVASSPINRFNMKKFFGEGTYEAVDPNDPNLDDTTPHKIEFTRTKENGEQVPYEVVDSTAKFTSSDWERVIAIFTIGKTWQFKAYPYGEERIADMFQRHCGFYIRLGTEKIPQDTIAKWKVKILTVSKSHRHTDSGTLREFWDTIDQFVQVSKINHLKS